MKSITTIVLSFLLTTFGIAQSAVFDIRKYGAPSGDITTVRTNLPTKI